MTKLATHRELKWGGYFRFLAGAGLLCAVAMLLGYGPTRRLTSPEAWPSMVAGCGVSLIASAVGGIPFLLDRSGTPGKPMLLVGLSAILRLMVVLALAVTTVLSGWFETAPLLVWVAISYAVLLFLDTRFALRSLKEGGVE